MTVLEPRVVGLAFQWGQVSGNVEFPTVNLGVLFVGSLVPLPIVEVGGNAGVVGPWYVGGGAVSILGGAGRLFSPTLRTGLLSSQGSRLELVWQPFLRHQLMIRASLGRF